MFITIGIAAHVSDVVRDPFPLKILSTFCKCECRTQAFVNIFVDGVNIEFYLSCCCINSHPLVLTPTEAPCVVGGTRSVVN